MALINDTKADLDYVPAMGFSGNRKAVLVGCHPTSGQRSNAVKPFWQMSHGGRGTVQIIDLQGFKKWALLDSNQ